MRRRINKIKRVIEIRKVIHWFVVLGFILGANGTAMAGNTATKMLMVSVQVLDKRSAHKAAVRSTPGIACVNTHTRVKETKIFSDSSIDHSLTIERGKNITITGKVENPLPDRDTLFIQSIASGAMSQDNILLSTTEQDLIASTTKCAGGSISNTYPFHYSLSTAADVLEEIQLTRPIVVVLTVYY